MADELPQQSPTDWPNETPPPAPVSPPPAWNAIKAEPDFAKLNPNEQLATFQHWRNTAGNYAATIPGWDPQAHQQEFNEIVNPEQQRLAEAAHAFNTQHPELPGIVAPPTQAEGFWGTLGRSFASRIIPSAAGAAGTLGGGAFGAVTTPELGGAGAIPGALAGGLGFEMAAEKAQRETMGEEWYNRNRQQMELNAKEHPYAHQIGTLFPFLLAATTGAGEIQAVKGLVGRVVSEESPKLARVLGGATERVITSGLGGARAGALSEVQEKGTPTSEAMATGAARGAVTLGAVGLLPAMNTILKQAIKGIPDAYVMAAAGEAYDAAHEHRAMDFNKISQEGGGSIAPFVIQNALLGALHGMPLRAKSGKPAPPEAKTPDKPQIEAAILQRQKDLEAMKAKGTITEDQQKELDDHNQLINMVQEEGAPQTPATPEVQPQAPAVSTELPPEKQATVDQVNKGLAAGEQPASDAYPSLTDEDRAKVEAMTPEQANQEAASAMQKRDDLIKSGATQGSPEYQRANDYASAVLDKAQQAGLAKSEAPTEEQRQAAEAQAKTLPTETLQSELEKPDAGFHDIIQAELNRRANAGTKEPLPPEPVAPTQTLEERIAAKTEAENAKARAIQDVEEQIPENRPFPKDVIFDTRDRELKGKQMWLEHIQDPEKDFTIQDLQKALGRDAGTEMYKQMWGEHEGSRAGRMVPIDENRVSEEVPTQLAEAEAGAAGPELAAPEASKEKEAEPLGVYEAPKIPGVEAKWRALVTPVLEAEQTLIDSGITDPKAFLDQVNEKKRAAGQEEMTMEQLAGMLKQAPDTGGERARSGQPRSLLPLDPELIAENLTAIEKMGALTKEDPLGNALEHISKNGTALQKLLAKILLGTGIDTRKVPIFFDNGMNAKGTYDPLTHQLFLNLNSSHEAAGLEGTLLHEALHHITVWKFNPAYKPTAYEAIQLQRIDRLLVQGRQAAMREILGRKATKEELEAFVDFYKGHTENENVKINLPKEVMDKLWENFNKYYGLANGKEFISEASNPEFVDFMSSLPQDRSITSRATNLYHQIKEYILNLVAGRPVAQQPALQKYLETIASAAQDVPEGKLGTFSIGLKSGEKPLGQQVHEQILHDMNVKGKTVQQISDKYNLSPDRLQDLHDAYAPRLIAERAGLTPEVLKELNPVKAGKTEENISENPWGKYASIMRDAGIPYIGNFLGAHDQMAKDAQDELAENPNAAVDRLKYLNEHKAGALAKDFHLFRAQLAQYRREEVAARRTGDADTAKAMIAKAANFMQKVYDKSAEAGKALQAVQGALDINTGDFFDLKSYYKMVFGKEFTPKEEKQVEKIVQATTEARVETLKNQIKMAQEIPKAAEGVINEAGEAIKSTKLTSAEKKAAATAGVVAVKDATGKDTNQLDFGWKFNPADAGKKLSQYLQARFEAKPYKIGQRNLTIREVGNIWQFIKTNYLDGTEYIRPDELIRDVAGDLHVDERVIKEAISAPKSIRQFVDARYRAQSQQRAIIQAFRAFADNADKGKAMEYLSKAWELPRSLAVVGHVNPSLTHAGSLLFRPFSSGKEEMASIMQAFRASFLGGKEKGAFFNLDPVSYHERLMQDTMGSENYGKLTNLGLAAKVGTLDDIGMYNNFLGKVGVAGNRGMDILKVLRMTLGEKEYKRLKGKDWFNELDEKNKDQVLREAMARINTETGTTTPGFTKIGNLLSGDWRTFLFAPRLEGSRWQQMVVDPFRAAGLWFKAGSATPAEKYFRTKVIARQAELIGTYVTALAANAAILQMTGSNDKINWKDPTRSDWLAFKIHGQTVLAPSSFLAPVRLGLSVGLAHILPWAENKQSFGDKIFSYANGKLTPTLSDMEELARAKQNYTGYPIEPLDTFYSAVKDKLGVKTSMPRNPKDPISIYHWASTKLPIPVSATVEGWYNAMREQGANSELAQNIIGASIAFVGSMFAVHEHPTTPEKEPK